MYIVFSIFSLTNEESIIYFSKNSPILISILLASAIASLAVILGMIGLDELREIHRLEEKKEKIIFNNLIKNLVWDICSILIAFIISSVLSIFSISGTFFIMPFSGNYSIEIYKIIFITNFFFLAISLYATYDIIQGLFNVCRIKYESIKNK